MVGHDAPAGRGPDPHQLRGPGGVGLTGLLNRVAKHLHRGVSPERLEHERFPAQGRGRLEHVSVQRARGSGRPENLRRLTWGAGHDDRGRVDVGAEDCRQIAAVPVDASGRFPRNRVEVTAGEESHLQNGTVEQPTRVTTRATVATWVGTFLDFQATPLGEAAREIERVYGTPVTIVDTTLARETITATFTDRPVQEIVNVVCSVLSARCEVRDGGVPIGR